jgi:hypothetical protein
VAVITDVDASAVGDGNVNVPTPAALVVVVADPRNVPPSPNPDASQAALS